jgi:hypothetical protein
MKRPPLALAALALLAACIPPRYQVATVRDDFAGTEVRRMEANLLDAPSGGRDWVALNAEVARDGRDSTRYALVVEYRADDDWLGIRPGESLLLLVDSQRVALASAGLAARERQAVGVREMARYPVPGDLLQRIAGAKEVRVRVLGRRYYLDRAFGPANFRRLREFLEPPAPAAATPPAVAPAPAGTP